MIAGVDGFRGGWVAAKGDDDGAVVLETFPTVQRLLERRELAGIVIDIPIGLPDRGPRPPDVAARRILRAPRASSVFPAPIRAVLGAHTYEEACRLWTEAEGKRCSRQLFAILGKIREVDQVMTPILQARMLEGHPELSFAMLNGGAPLAHYKGTATGREERLSLLRPHFPTIDALLADPAHARLVIDVIDAHALLWTARRLRRREAIIIPDAPTRDQRGLRMMMVA